MCVHAFMYICAYKPKHIGAAYRIRACCIDVSMSAVCMHVRVFTRMHECTSGSDV
jgi:hypothetical protein